MNVNQCLSVIASIVVVSSPQPKIVASRGPEQYVLERLLAQIVYFQKGLIPTYPEKHTQCVKGVNDEDMTIFHLLCCLGFVQGKMPHPSACGCFHLQTKSDITANIAAVYTALGRPKLREDLKAKITQVIQIASRHVDSKSKRCFFNLQKSLERDKPVYETLPYPVFDPEDVFTPKVHYFPKAPEAPPAAEEKAWVVSNVTTGPITTRRWFTADAAVATVIATSISKARRVHVNPEDIRSGTERAKAALAEIQALAAEREKDVKLAVAVRDAEKENEAVMAALAIAQAKLKALDSELEKATS